MKTPQNDPNHPLNTHAVAELIGYMIQEFEREDASPFRPELTGQPSSDRARQIELLRHAQDAAQRRDSLALLGVGCEFCDRQLEPALGSWLKDVARAEIRPNRWLSGFSLPTNEDLAEHHRRVVPDLPELPALAAWIKHEAQSITGSNIDAVVERIVDEVRAMAKRYAWRLRSPHLGDDKPVRVDVELPLSLAKSSSRADLEQIASTLGVEHPLCSLIKRVRHAINTSDEKRGTYLSGVLLECKGRTATMTATDGHRLTRASIEVGFEVPLAETIFLPKSSVDALHDALVKFPTANIRIGAKNILVSSGLHEIQIQLDRDMTYPPFRQVLEHTGLNATRWVCNRADLYAAIMKGKESEPKSENDLQYNRHTLDLVFKAPSRGGHDAIDQISVRSKPQHGERIGPVYDVVTGHAHTTDEERVEMRFNMNYLLDALLAGGLELTPAMIDVVIAGPTDPLVIRMDLGSTGKYIASVMPIRV